MSDPIDPLSDRDLLSLAAQSMRVAEPRENVMGQLEEVLIMVQGRMRAIAGDATAFVGFGGGYDAKMIAAWNGLATTCSKLLGQIEDLRGSDRRVSEAIDEAVKTFGMSISGPLGEEFRTVFGLIEALCAITSDPTSTKLDIAKQAELIRSTMLKLSSNTIIRIMNDAAAITLRSTNELYRSR